MKKNSFVIFIIVGILLFMPSFVYASEVYKNSQGLSLSSDEYDKLLQLYSPKYIDTMTSDDYQTLLDKKLDFDTISKTKKYIKTVINHVTGEVNEFQVSENEYNNAIQPKGCSYIETQYKTITLVVLRTGSQAFYASFNCVWKYWPATTSFDLIGFRVTNLNVVFGTQTGRQVYDDVNFQTHVINYAYNGTNINNQLNGFGISMNLVDQYINYLECQINCDFGIESFPVKFFASYQHAVRNVTLAFSKNYTLSAGGMGNVFYGANNFYQKYDGMQGLYEYFIS